MLDPYENAPLSALVLFETSEEVAVRVTIKGKDENTTYSYEFDKAYVHMLPIYGLYPSCMNEVIIEAEGKENVLMIETADLPEDFVLPDYVYADKQYLNNELYFFTPSSIGYTCAYDTNGDVRWYLNQTAIFGTKNFISFAHEVYSTHYNYICIG